MWSSVKKGKLIIPVSAIIATKDRPEMLKRTVRGITVQSCIPTELIIVDGSDDDLTKNVCEEGLNRFDFKTVYMKATTRGAAPQRRQGMSVATQSTIWFLDDDIIMEAECAQRLWNGFHFQNNVGAVNAMIINQRYTPPGRITRLMYRLMHGSTLFSYAGRLIGPAWNLLPEDDPALPAYVPCEWLNTTCTMYKREVMPNPVFQDFFKGYSLMEDVALSVTIARTHTLLNARTSRIFHDSQTGDHKSNVKDLAKMELVNRHYIMVHVLGRGALVYYLKLAVFEFFGIVGSLTGSWGWKNLGAVLGGKLAAIRAIVSGK